MLIKISNLEVKYGSKFVLKNMNLSLNTGEITDTSNFFSI